MAFFITRCKKVKRRGTFLNLSQRLMLNTKITISVLSSCRIPKVVLQVFHEGGLGRSTTTS